MQTLKLNSTPYSLAAKLRIFVLLGASILNAFAQTQATPPAEKEVSDKTLVLNPFTVTAGEDRGYLAQSSASGSRLAANLKDIATPTTAFTREFMEDWGITDITALAGLMLSTEYNYGEAAGPQNAVLSGEAQELRMRGLPGGLASINFFEVGVGTDTNMRFDMFSLERVDQSRGPNSILFGISSPGGSLNVTTKQATFNRTKTQVGITARSWGGLREEIDFNLPLVKNKLAVRFAAMNTNRDSWRNWEYDDQQRVFGTVKWQIDSVTQLNVEVEQGHIDKATKRTYTAFDAYTPWVQGGRRLSATANTALGIQSLGNAPYVVYDSATGTLMNWAGKTSSFRRVTADGLPIALTDFSVLPRETVVYGPGNSQKTDYTRLTGSLTRTFFKHLTMELAAYQLRQRRVVNDPNPNASLYLLVDTNATLPNGQPNPNAGRPYLESQQFIQKLNSPQDAIRLSMAYDFDLGKFGRHRLATVAQYGHAERDNATLAERILTNPYNTTAPENAQNTLRRRTYVDLTGSSNNIVLADWGAGPVAGLPITGATSAASRSAVDVGFIPFNTSTQIQSFRNASTIGVLQSAFFNNRLHTVFGASRDIREAYSSQLGRTDPVGSFSQGYYYPVRGTEATRFTANNISFNSVLHLTDWVSFSYNQSINASLGNSGAFITERRHPPTPRGRSKDYGLKFDLLDRRIYLTATYFETAATKNSAFIGVRAGDVNPIWNALDNAGVLQTNGLQIENVEDTSTVVTFDSVATGVELELIANPTPNWRVYANFSESKIRRTNIGQEMRDYITKNRPFWQSNGNVLLLNPIGTATTISQYLGVLDELVVNEFDLPEGELSRGQAPRKGNLRTVYNFSSGALKGVMIGTGARYEGKAITSFSSVRDPLSGAVVKQTGWRDAQMFLDANLGYRSKGRAFGKAFNWSVQLNVNNVLGEDSLVPLITTGTGEIVTYRFPTPREFVFTAKLDF